jgi:excisionase family DNA binding protein
MISDIARQTIDIPEMAKLLGVSRNFGYEMAKTGTVRTIRLGRRIVVPVSEIARLLKGAGTENVDYQ